LVFDYRIYIVFCWSVCLTVYNLHNLSAIRDYNFKVINHNLIKYVVALIYVELHRAEVKFHWNINLNKIQLTNVKMMKNIMFNTP